jgi:hypothetical protein
VSIDDVGRSSLHAHRLERRAAQQREPKSVVGIVASVGDVIVRPIEAGLMLDQAQPIAPAGRAPYRYRHAPAVSGRYEHVEFLGWLGSRDAAVKGQVDVHLVAELTQCARQRVDDVGQAAGLGKRLTL